MSEADEQFGKRLAEDLERQLGPSVVVLTVLIDRSDEGARMLAACAAGDELFEAEATGENELAAYERLRTAIVEQRLGRAFRRVVDLPHGGRGG